LKPGTDALRARGRLPACFRPADPDILAPIGGSIPIVIHHRCRAAWLAAGAVVRRHDPNRSTRMHVRGGVIAVIAAAACALGCVIGARSAVAFEGGQSNYYKGYRDFMTGVLPGPGVVIRNDLMTYRGTEQSPVKTGSLNIRLRNYNEVFGVTVITPYRILGGHYAFGARLAGTRAEVARTATTALGSNYRDGSFTGFSDPVINPLTIGWHAGKLHWNVATAVWMPYGSYDVNRMVNTSKNAWAWSAQLGVTYFDPQTGLDLSGAAIYVFNYENPATHYKSGDVFHLDATIGYAVLPSVTLGAVGYLMQQMTDDSGAGNLLGDRRARSLGAGPAVKYTTRIGETPVSFVAKYLRDLSVENTTQGSSASLSMRVNF
jgi:hypothetical protein